MSDSLSAMGFEGWTARLAFLIDNATLFYTIVCEGSLAQRLQAFGIEKGSTPTFFLSPDILHLSFHCMDKLFLL